jgi:hypothetical protein
VDRRVGMLTDWTWRRVWDHTLCAMVNDLRVRARLARPLCGKTLAMNRENVLPLFPGGQVVAGGHMSKHPLAVLTAPQQRGRRGRDCPLRRVLQGGRRTS